MTKKNLKELTRAITRMKRLSDILAQRLAEVKQKPAEINNYFGEGCNAQVFYGGVTSRFAKKTKRRKKRKPSPVPSRQSDEQPSLPDVPTLVARVDRVREYFWSDSALAVIFCVCRDCYGYLNNMSQFERDFHCKEGLLSNAFRNNPYMRLHIDRWPQQAVKQRVMRLVEAYRKAIEELQAA